MCPNSLDTQGFQIPHVLNGGLPKFECPLLNISIFVNTRVNMGIQIFVMKKLIFEYPDNKSNAKL